MSTVIDKILSVQGRGLAKADDDMEKWKHILRLQEEALEDSTAESEDSSEEEEGKNKNNPVNKIFQPENSTGVGENMGNKSTGHFMRVVGQNNSAGGNNRATHSDRLRKKRRGSGPGRGQ